MKAVVRALISVAEDFGTQLKLVVIRLKNFLHLVVNGFVKLLTLVAKKLVSV